MGYNLKGISLFIYHPFELWSILQYLCQFSRFVTGLRKIGKISLFLCRFNESIDTYFIRSVLICNKY